MTEKEDERLLLLIAETKTRYYGFNLLVRKYQERIYWLVRKMLISHDDSNDVVQNIFLKIWLNIGSFRGDCTLYTWIYRIAVNETITAVRKKGSYSLLPFHDHEEHLTDSLKADPYFSGNEIQMKLQNAILSLPVKQRLVFTLKYYEEMPYEEMSEILGTSIGALKASYHFANKKIQEYLCRN